MVRLPVGHPGKSELEIALIGTFSARAGYVVAAPLKVPAAGRQVRTKDTFRGPVIPRIILIDGAHSGRSSERLPGARRKEAAMVTPKSMKILVAVDGSTHSQAAVQFVRALPLAAGSTVTVLGVLTLRKYFYTPDRAALLAALDAAEATLRDSAAEVRTGLRQGHPAEEICRHAEEQPTDLVVVGAQGLRATLGILLGGVAQQVVEHARWPVLVVHAPFTPVRHVLLATDGSPHSASVASFAARFPFPAGTEVRAIQVLPPEVSPASMVALTELGEGVTYPMAEQIAAEQNEADESAAKANLAEVRATLETGGLTASSVLMRGDAVTELLRYIRAQEIDLIVAGSRGLSNIQGWLLGSVSRKLVHYAACSVLLVRGEPLPHS